MVKRVAYNTGVLSSNPTRVAIKIPLVRKATGSHLIKPTSLEIPRALSMVLLHLKSSMPRSCRDSGREDSTWLPTG